MQFEKCCVRRHDASIKIRKELNCGGAAQNVFPANFFTVKILTFLWRRKMTKRHHRIIDD